MKKFLFILCSALISNSLFSVSFKKEVCKTIVADFFDHNFLDQVSDKASSIECLKQIAEKYLKLLRKNKNYKDALKELNDYILANNNFKLNNDDSFFISYILQEKMQQWLEQLKTEVETPETLMGYEELASPVQVTTSFEARSVVRSADAIADLTEKKAAKIFTKALIKVCNERIKNQQACSNQIIAPVSIASDVLALSMIIDVRAISNEVNTTVTINPNKNAFKSAIELAAEKTRILKVKDIIGINSIPVDDVPDVRAISNRIRAATLNTPWSLSRKAGKNILVLTSNKNLESKNMINDYAITAIRGFSTAMISMLAKLIYLDLRNSENITGVENFVVNGGIAMVNIISAGILENFRKKMKIAKHKRLMITENHNLELHRF